ncbi:hypothetical protein PR048_026333 [Dryococelus australis]|uniref:Peptidase A2 domain-containing protein n=1 Tax=Dryococelus australis TaxID=614101 RepID=A0ABQ9GL09_9NEOP|nr:hypothetical protein PR048_026333 [Dryococelus australis]
MAAEKKEAGAMKSTYILAPPASFDFRRPEEWGSWFKRFQRYRLVSGLLEKSGEIHVKAEDIMNSFNLSDEESTSYEVVVKRFEAHFIPKRNVIYERAKFNLRSQLADESVDTFVTALHSLAEKCEYKSMQNELIRDRLVLGLLDKMLSEMLQLDATLTLETAVNKARQTEVIRKQQLIVQKSNWDQPMEENIDRIGLIGKEISSPWRTEVNVGGQVIQFKIDTGADVTVVPEQVFGSRYSASDLEIKPVNTQLFGPCSSPLKIQGKSTTLIKWRGLGVVAATYTIRLKNDAVPLSLHAPCRVALPLQPKLKQEIDRLVNMGIISPMDRPTE